MSGLVSSLTLNAKDKFERNISGEGAARAGKGFTLFISNKNMNNIIKVIKSIEGSGVLIDGVTETVKHDIKKQEREFLGVLLTPLVTSLVQRVSSSVVKGISGTGVRRAGSRYIDSKF